MIGDQISHYRILERLGAGGMGEVFKAEDTRLGRQVALKFLPPELGRDSGAKARFIQEAKAASAIDHDNVCTIFDIGETDEGRLFLAMAYYEGESLDNLIASGPLEIDRALDIAEQVARGLKEAHGRGISHRDIKPANVMITSGGVAKIVDFGLAKLGEEPGLTATGALMGTPSYMSPEQARGEKADPRTDLWSLGVVLYEMLAGRRPFVGFSSANVLHAVLYDEPERIGALRQGLSPATERLVERLMARSLDARSQTAEEVLDLIREAREKQSSIEVQPISHSGTQSLRPTEILLTQEPSPNSSAQAAPGGRGRLLLAGAIVLALVAALTLTWWLMTPDPPLSVTDRSIAVLPFETLGASEASAFTDGIHGDILTRLSKVPDLSVTSRTSVMQYRNPEKSLPEIAQELGVTWVLLGEVQEAGGQVQVNARLVNSAEDRQIWAESFRHELTAEKLFEIQAEITEAIAAQLAARLAPTESRRAARIPTDSLEAYRNYAEGRTLMDRRSAEGMRTALDRFETATQMDPEFALAWAGMAEASALLEAYAFAPRGSLIPAGFEAVERALALDPELAEAHAAHGLLLGNSGRGPEALEATKRAIELRPSYSEGQSWLSVGNYMSGFPEEALARAERAVDLSPLSGEARANLALSAMANGDYTRGLRESRRLREQHPGYATGHFWEAVALHHLGEHEEARALLEGLSVAWTGSGAEALLAITCLRTDDPERARELLAQFEDREEPFEAGLVHAALGERDAAFAAFEGLDNRHMWAIVAIRYFFPEELGPLREDPRWQDVMRRIEGG